MLRRHAGENRQRDIRNAYERRPLLKRNRTGRATAGRLNCGRFIHSSYARLILVLPISAEPLPRNPPNHGDTDRQRGRRPSCEEQRAQGGTGEMAILEMLRAYLNEAKAREDGVVGMEYAVVAAVVIVAVATALTAGQPAISGIVNTALTAVQNAIT
jgi:Flp pilus assembly pilin Flp